jgi:RNA polymerase sigma-70 factor (ECF subfamily)
MQREWVEAAQRGDHAAFAAIASEVLDRSFAAAVQILRDQALAEDAVQEAMIRAWRDLPSLRDPERFEAWLRRLVVHACFDEVRRARRRRTAESRAEPRAAMVSDAQVALARRDSVERALAQLSPMHRAALVLRHVQDLSVPEVAEALGIPLGTAKSRLHHAERAVREAITAADEATVTHLLGEGR